MPDSFDQVKPHPHKSLEAAMRCQNCGAEQDWQRRWLGGGKFDFICQECGHKRRPQKANKKLRQQVGDRDGWLCHHCEFPINRKANFPHPLAAVADHYPVPYNRGGPAILANLRIAHSYCNGSSGHAPQTSTRYILTDADRRVLGKINLIFGPTLAHLERSAVTDKVQRRAIVNRIDERQCQVANLITTVHTRPWRIIRNLRLRREIRALRTQNHDDFKALGLNG